MEFSSLHFVRLQLHQPIAISWWRIVRSLPLALDFHSVLRCRMTESRIDAGQRTLADLCQYLHVNAGLLVGGRVGHEIGVAASEPVYRTLDRVHRHVEFLAVYAVSDQGTHSNLPVARDQLHPRSALNAALLGEFRGNFHKHIGSLLSNSLCAVGKVAFVKMLQKPAIVQV